MESAQIWTIRAIWEAEYGCEELPDDGEILVELLLESPSGASSRLLVSDSVLYALQLGEGDQVLVTADGQIASLHS